jgi:hypothetical protein
MQDSATRRQVLKNMAGAGVAGTVSTAFASEAPNKDESSSSVRVVIWSPMPEHNRTPPARPKDC